MIVTKAHGEHAALCLIFTLACGCASGPSTTAASSAPIISAEAQQQIQVAKDEYRACLVAAAKFADNGHYSDLTLPRVITPMCYPQFARFQAALMVGQPADAQRAIVRDGDQRQIEYAGLAIEQERGRTTVAANR